MDLKKGESVPVPCRHCSQLSVKVSLREGNQELRCPKCSRDTRFRIRRETTGWKVWSEGRDG